MKLKSINKEHSGNFLQYYTATYENKDKQLKKYELVSRNSSLSCETLGNILLKKSYAVGIICYNKDKSKILLQKEYRMTCGEWVYNFPGGLIDDGETMQQAAYRELYEETGLQITEIIDTLCNAYTAIGISDESTSTVICKADGEIKNSTLINEEIEASWYSKEEIRKILKTVPMSLRTQAYLYLFSLE